MRAAHTSVLWETDSAVGEEVARFNLADGGLNELPELSTLLQARLACCHLALAGEPRTRLCSAAIAPDIIDAIVKPHDVGSNRLRLILDCRSPLETFQTERDDFQIAYNQGALHTGFLRDFSLDARSLRLPRGFTNFGIGTVGAIGVESEGCSESPSPTPKSETLR
jgi:hypothetical protein